MLSSRTAVGLFLVVLSLGIIRVPVVSAQATGGRQMRSEVFRMVVRPRVGDTLRLQMEQSIEIRGQPAGSRTVPQPDYGPRRDSGEPRSTRLRLFAHSLVESSDLRQTTLLATSDSLAVWVGPAAGTGGYWQAMSEDAEQLRVSVMPDGSMMLVNPSLGSAAIGATLAAVPGLLPSAPVRVGSEWTRDMVLPVLPLGGYRADGAVRVQLRLDSLTRDGRDAWISLAGSLQRGAGPSDWPAGVRVVTQGIIRGQMLFDRERAWIMDALTELDLLSEQVLRSSAQGAPRSIVRTEIRVVQQLRVR